MKQKRHRHFVQRVWFKMAMASLSAILLILMFPPFEMPFLAWFALVPLLSVIRGSRLSGSFIFALVTGVIFYGFFLRWLFGTDGVNVFNYGLGVFFKGMFYGMFGVFAWYFRNKLPAWNVITLPSSWIMLEYLRSHLSFLSSPWGILGYSQYAVLPVAHVASYAGVYGISFLIIFVNVACAEFVQAVFSAREMKGSRSQPVSLARAFPIVLLVGGLFLLGAFDSSARDAHVPEMKVALVQGNIYWNDRYLAEKYRDDDEYREAVFDKYARLTRQAATHKPELILWPSSSVPGKIPYDQTRVGMLSALARETESFLLVGSSGFDKFNPEQRRTKRLANSAFLFSPLGEILGRYDKILLLPFDEYLPLREYVKWPSWIAADMIDALPGTEKTIFEVDGKKFAVLICWENMFPELFREMASKGVQFMVSMTNEGFTKNPAGHAQMLAVNVFRAVENNVAIARTASTGVSCIIDPQGRIIDRVKDERGRDVDVEGSVVGRIPLTSERSFYNRYGDWFLFVTASFVLGIVLWHAIIRKYFSR